MATESFRPSELILNDDGSVYHLALKEEHVADHVVIVGDQARVNKISKHFDDVEFKIQNREFRTHTGIYKGTRISVISTGIGTDNIDIFMNELDAAVNMDFIAKKPNVNKKALNIIRVGTTGALHADIKVGSHVISRYGLGLDGLLHFYNYAHSDKETEILNRIQEHLNWPTDLPSLYLASGSEQLLEALGKNMVSGITATAPGFYAPQGRRIILSPRYQTNVELLQSFNYGGLHINNLEMETSAFYGLGSMLGHNCCTCCVVLANRATGEFTEDHSGVVEQLIQTVLERIVDMANLEN